MPENISTRTANEKRIRAYAEATGEKVSRSKCQRLALKWEKRCKLIPMSELRHLFGHSDRTAELALSNVLNEGISHPDRKH
ncbi:hypothetical protein ACTXM3_15670 [Glutamicibacter arilaitensis]|uniref:Uncharacterized protein n=1 Tax=Glutamicibacter arilaitensis TaxID=256701 RepID=A0A2N7RZM8_9MICC|nr:hypothetical protein [Glutamicibacter arilaitensis]PMQ19343.1 hypothetical protein CIK84_11625 [Glutamicibacter arilaitensis]